jgi:hypothetical protein
MCDLRLRVLTALSHAAPLYCRTIAIYGYMPKCIIHDLLPVAPFVAQDSTVNERALRFEAEKLALERRETATKD